MNKKIFIILIAVFISISTFRVANAQSIPQMSPWRVVSGVIQPTNPNNAVRLSTTTSGCTGISATGELYSTGTACGTGGGGGGSAGGTWSTTTSTVSGQLINYTNNTTDIAAIGANSTTTAEFYFDPNTNRFIVKSGNIGVGTTTPIANLTVVGSTYLKGNTYLNIDGGRQFLRGVDATLSRGTPLSGESAITATTTIAFIGDSWTESTQITEPIREYMQRVYGDAGGGWISANTNSIVPSKMTRTQQGSWTNPAVGTDFTYGPSLYYARSTSVATTTFTGIATDIVIQYMDVNLGANLTYAIDGAGTTTVSTANVSTSTKSIKISNLAKNVTHRLDIVTGGTGTGVYLLGSKFFVNRSGVVIDNLGQGGNQASDYLTQTESYWNAALTALQPNLVVISLGVNEATNSVTPETYKTNILALINRVRSATPLASILLMSQSDIGSSPTYSMDKYTDTLVEIAADEQLGFINNYALIGDYTTANSRGLYGSANHPNVAGYQLIANHFISYLNQGYVTTPTSVAGGTNDADGNFYIGIDALKNVESGYRNFAVGFQSLYNTTTGYENTANSTYSMFSNTTGSQNTATGFGSMFSNTTGSRNSLFGYKAYFLGTTGNDNSGLGYNALYSNTGSSNTGVGAYSIDSNTGSENTAVGYQSLSGSLTGGFNTGVGSQALLSNTSGIQNTSVGYGSLQSLTTGSYNVGLGSIAAALNTTGVGNIAIGRGALYDMNIIDGTGYNTAVGYFAGRGITTGKNNTIIGANTTGLPATLSNNIIIADGSGNRRINVLDTGYIGLGTTTPTSKTTIYGTASEPSLTHEAYANLNIVGYGGGTDLAITASNASPYTASIQNRHSIIDGNSYPIAINPLGGNVGIGTTSPGTRFSIGDTGANTINISPTATSTFGSGINLRTGCFAVNGVCISGGGGGGSAGPVTTTLEATCEPQTDSTDFAPGGAYWQPIYGWTFTNATSSRIICSVAVPANLATTPNILLLPYPTATSTPSTGIAVLDVTATTTNSGQNWYTTNYTDIHAASTTAAKRWELTTGTSLPLNSTTTIALAGLVTPVGGDILKFEITRYGADANDTVDNDVFIPKVLVQLDTN